MAVFEFGHGYLVVSTLNAAATRAARLGSMEKVTTAQARARARSILAKSIRPSTPGLAIYIKDASLFDDSSVDPSSIDYASLPDIELSAAETRQLFLVRIQVPYNEVALMPPLWIDSITISSQAVMRHE